MYKRTSYTAVKRHIRIAQNNANKVCRGMFVSKHATHSTISFSLCTLQGYTFTSLYNTLKDAALEYMQSNACVPQR